LKLLKKGKEYRKIIRKEDRMKEVPNWRLRFRKALKMPAQ